MLFRLNFEFWTHFFCQWHLMHTLIHILSERGWKLPGNMLSATTRSNFTGSTLVRVKIEKLKQKIKLYE